MLFYNYTKILSWWNTMEFYVLGIVRNVDPIRQVLYVLTPLSLEALQRVNTLLKGNLEIPAALLLSVSTGRSLKKKKTLFWSRVEYSKKLLLKLRDEAASLRWSSQLYERLLQLRMSSKGELNSYLRILLQCSASWTIRSNGSWWRISLWELIENGSEN